MRKRKFGNKQYVMFIVCLVIIFGSFYGSFCYFLKGNSQIAATNKYKVVNTEVQAATKSSLDKKNNKTTLTSKDDKNCYDIKKIRPIIEGKAEDDGKKIAFLTFDDGPSTSVTPKVLDVLKRFDVKATFFMVGNCIESNEASKKLVKRVFKEGHAIGNHSYTHKLRKIYPHNKLNIDIFMNEIEKTNNVFKKILGQDFHTRAIRMPGGYMSRVYYKDPNLDEFDSILKQKGLYSIDWNALSYDAEGRRKNASELLAKLKKSVGTQEKVVILMHDTYGKEQTALALPAVIKYLKVQGYEFKIIK